MLNLVHIHQIKVGFPQNGKSVVAVAVDENGGTESPANSSVAITLQTPASRGSVDKAIQVLQYCISVERLW